MLRVHSYSVNLLTKTIFVFWLVLQLKYNYIFTKIYENYRHLNDFVKNKKLYAQE